MQASQISEVGTCPETGQALRQATLNSDVLSLSVLNFGAATRDLRYKMAKGGSEAGRPLILGFEEPMRYLDNPDYMGVIAGRVAGRIKNAAFSLAGRAHGLEANEGTNQLHGGPKGLSHQFWDLHQEDSTTAVLTHFSNAGEMGFPGRAAIQLTITLVGNSVTYDLRAEVTEPTPISLAQHNYYNLAGAGQIWEHRLWADVGSALGLDETGVPDGRICSLRGKPYDLRPDPILGVADLERGGSDVNLCFVAGRNTAEPVARLRAPDGLTMTVFSDQPGAQFYTATAMAPDTGGLASGAALGPFAGVCFEPQGYPNAVNQPDFPSVIVTPDRPYRQRLKLVFDQA